MPTLLQKIRNKESNILDNSIFVIIILSAVVLGLETDQAILHIYKQLFHDFDLIILFIFLAEIVIKMVAQGRQPWRYFYDPWNIFDFAIVLLSVVPYVLTHGQDDSHIVVVFRLLRLVRALRVLRVFRLITHLKPLQLIIETLIHSIPSISYVVLLLGLWFYVYAVLGVFVFGSHDITNFGTIYDALLTLFACATGNWTGTMTNLIDLNNKSNPHFIFNSMIPFYFITFYFVGGLIILNLFIGIIVSELQIIRASKEKEEIRESFADDLDEQSAILIKQIQFHTDSMNQLYKELQISLDKNKLGT